MNIRLASEADLPAINECIREAFEGYIGRIGQRPPSMDRQFLPLIREARVYVFETGRGVEGTMVITEGADQVEISSVAVGRSSQGQGIGRQLMKAAESIALRKGFNKLSLFTNAALPELSSYYKSLGYVTSIGASMRGSIACSLTCSLKRCSRVMTDRPVQWNPLYLVHPETRTLWP